MDTKIYVSEVKGSTKCATSLEVLNAYKAALLKESKDSELNKAAKALENARAAYQKESTRVVLADSEYNKLQTECVRTAVSEFSHKHNLPTFATWFDENDKDVQTSLLDTPQRLGAHVKSLHDSFASGAKVARKKAKTLQELRAEAAEILSRVAELEKAGVE